MTVTAAAPAWAWVQTVLRTALGQKAREGKATLVKPARPALEERRWEKGLAPGPRAPVRNSPLVRRSLEEGSLGDFSEWRRVEVETGWPRFRRSLV